MKLLIRNKRGGHINFMISLILIGLFAIAIVTFAVKFASDNNSKVNLASDTDFSEMNTDIKENITTFYSNIDTARNATDQSTISTQTEATEGGTAFKVGPATALKMAVSTIIIGFKKIFGSDTGFGIFLTALISVLVFISIMYIIKAWAGRNPD